MKRIFAIAIFTGLFLTATFAQVERKVIVEHFTNTRCSVCATKNPGFYNVLEDYPEVIHLAYHPSSPYSACVFSQHNPVENDARTNHYGIYGGTPRVVMQGQVIGSQTPLLKAGQIEGALGQQSDYSISVVQTKGTGSQVELRFVIKQVSGVQSDNLSLRAVLAEKSLDYNAPNGETKHYDVFRKQLLDEAITLPGMNDSLVILRNYTTNAEWDSEQVKVYTTLENSTTNEIFQADESDFITTGPSGIFDPIASEASSVFYPNPATTELRILPEIRQQYEAAEFYDLTGSKVLETSLTGPVDISSIPNGLYFVILKGTDDTKITTRVIKAGR